MEYPQGDWSWLWLSDAALFYYSHTIHVMVHGRSIIMSLFICLNELYNKVVNSTCESLYETKLLAEKITFDIHVYISDRWTGVVTIHRWSPITHNGVGYEYHSLWSLLDIVIVHIVGWWNDFVIVKTPPPLLIPGFWHIPTAVHNWLLI